jgi:hypothetical protein
MRNKVHVRGLGVTKSLSQIQAGIYKGLTIRPKKVERESIEEFLSRGGKIEALKGKC